MSDELKFESMTVNMADIVTDGKWPAPPKMLENVRRNGIINPVVILLHDGKYYLRDGRSRHACARELEHKTIRAIVIKASPLLVGDILTLSSNIHGGNHLSEANALNRLSEHMSESELELYSGMSKKTREKRLSLLKLHPKIQEMVETGELAVGAGYKLARLDYSGQLSALESANEMGRKGKASVSDVDYAVSAELHRRNPTLPMPPPILLDEEGKIVSMRAMVSNLRKIAASLPAFRAETLEAAAREIEKEIDNA